jgi:Ca2+-binding RTX toxin-like protein
VITWRSPGQDGSDDIYQQRFKSNGEPYATPVVDQRVNVRTADHQVAPSITALIDGGWVVTWRSSDGDGGGIYQQRFKSNGEPYTTPVVDQRVNVTTAGFQWQQKVTALADGGWVVTWTSTDEDGTVTGICQQVFDSNGVAVSEGDLLINVMTAGRQNEPNVTALADGGWVVTWSSRNANGGTDIHQQRFMSNKAPAEVALSAASVQENAAAGTVVGSLSAQDVNLSGGDALTFTLLDNAGGRFAVQGDKLVVANGGLLDYETARSHNVTVQVKDKDGLTSERSFAVTVGDVTEVPPGQTLIGTSRANNLVGGAGNDKLYGKGGKDVLTGNGGQDIFVFDTKPNTKTNRDTVRDFSVADDTIWLSDRYFKKLGKGSEASPTKLKKAFFKVADKAKDKNDYLVYNKKTGVLSYDVDGSGAAKAVEIAKLAKNLKLTQDDFFIV